MDWNSKMAFTKRSQDIYKSMKIAIFHELQVLSGARKVAEEYGKLLSKNHTVDLYYVDEKEDKSLTKIFNEVIFFKFKEKQWRGNNWKKKLYKDTVELVNLYRLHVKIARLIKNEEYDFILINPSKFTQAPFLLSLVSKTVYFCQEPLRMVYDSLFKSSKSPFPKNIYERLNREVRKSIDKFNIKNAGVVLANSRFSVENIKNAYEIDAELCYLGVDVNKFKDSKTKKIYDLLFVGEKSDIEGYDLLQKTLRLYKKRPRLFYVSRKMAKE
jgi:hypothetical protein